MIFPAWNTEHKSELNDLISNATSNYCDRIWHNDVSQRIKENGGSSRSPEIVYNDSRIRGWPFVRVNPPEAASIDENVKKEGEDREKRQRSLSECL